MKPNPFLALSAAVLVGAMSMLPASLQAGPVADRVKRPGTLRVCVWPDYYGAAFRIERIRRNGLSPIVVH